MVACAAMISLASLLPLARVLSYMSEAQREAWARRLAQRSLSRNGSRVRRARKHLHTAFPQLDNATLDECLAAHFRHRYRMVLNIAWLRYAPVAQITESISVWDGVEWLKAHPARGRGVIVATPHFGDWERFSLAMGTQVSAAVLYKPASDPAVERWLKALRSRTGVVPVPATAKGIRELYKRLNHGGIVGILPDQVPKRGAGVPTEFFGRPAETMTLIHRLVQSTGCAVKLGRCFAVYDEHKRVPRYHLKISSAPDDVEDVNPEISAQALNDGIEQVVQEAIPQYLWTYKRWVH